MAAVRLPAPAPVPATASSARLTPCQRGAGKSNKLPNFAFPPPFSVQNSALHPGGPDSTQELPTHRPPQHPWGRRASRSWGTQHPISPRRHHNVPHPAGRTQGAGQTAAPEPPRAPIFGGPSRKMVPKNGWHRKIPAGGAGMPGTERGRGGGSRGK